MSTKPSGGPATKGLSDSDIDDLFHSVVPGRQGDEWQESRQTVDEKERLRTGKLLFERMFSKQDTSLVKTRKTQSLNPDATLANVLFAVTRFTDYLSPGALEARIQRIENALQAMRESGTTAETSPASLIMSLRRAKELAPSIVAAFREAYGVEPKTVTLAPDTEGEHTVIVEIDVGSDQARDVEKRRLEGARKQFYELLLSKMSPSDLDLLSFEFHFPTQ